MTRPLPRDRGPGVAVAPAFAVGAAGCLPTPAPEQGREISDLYAVFLAGGIVVGALVWVLATWAIVRYRRRDDSLPRQTHGNLRVEAIWTAIPLVTVLVLFGLTVRTQMAVDAVKEVASTSTSPRSAGNGRLITPTPASASSVPSIGRSRSCSPSTRRST
jgi:heme/copper-type cytochrome/quinol oxidase subunit 2